jgi:hypothetical protein
MAEIQATRQLWLFHLKSIDRKRLKSRLSSEAAPHLRPQNDIRYYAGKRIRTEIERKSIFRKLLPIRTGE